MLAIICNFSKTIIYLDSLKKNRNIEAYESLHNILLDYLNSKYVRSKGSKYEKYDIEIPLDYPSQSKRPDCGLFVLKYIRKFCNDRSLNYSQPLRDIKENWFSDHDISELRQEIKNKIRILSETQKETKDEDSN